MRALLLLLALFAGALACLAGCGGSSPTEPPPPPPGGPRTEAEPNDFTAQSLGALGTNDYVVSGFTANGSDVDLYSVSASSAFALHASLDWSTATDLELTISNGSGIFIRHVDTAGHPEACTVLGLPAGTYTVRVGSLSAVRTDYQLTLGAR